MWVEKHHCGQVLQCLLSINMQVVPKYNSSFFWEQKWWMEARKYVSQSLSTKQHRCKLYSSCFYHWQDTLKSQEKLGDLIFLAFISTMESVLVGGPHGLLTLSSADLESFSVLDSILLSLGWGKKANSCQSFQFDSTSANIKKEKKRKKATSALSRDWGLKSCWGWRLVQGDRQA